ncbi:MAG TPA: hypothetical protein VN873_19585 [Candidatus Angelobacter sp.]|nr:hypothetical protein [Candidatus Angelobacter sp.]
MSAQRIRWVLLALVSAAILALLALYIRHGASAPKVAGTFLGYTNAASTTFAVVKFANHENVPIHWHGVWVEYQDDSTQHHAPVMNPSLPWITKASLQVGGSETLAVGKPVNQVPWRVCWEYSPEGSTNIYTATSKWFEP